jgi:predicted nucleic acid-binding Zn ribbon protein
MTWREPTRVGQLLPGVLAQLARSSGNATHLQSAWEKIAGPGIAKQSTPLRIEGDTLVISVSDRNWVNELRKHEAQLRARLNAASPGLRISRLEFMEPACPR